MKGAQCCFYCADFKEGKCVGKWGSVGFDEDEMRDRMHGALTSWLSYNFASDIAHETIAILQNSLAIKIENPREFYCANWR